MASREVLDHARELPIDVPRFVQRYYEKEFSRAAKLAWEDFYNGGRSDEKYELYRELSVRFRALKQRPFIRSAGERGIEIPSEHFEPKEFASVDKVLTDNGYSWLRRQIRQSKKNDAKDWIAIVMPILSLLSSTAIAILGLVVALKKH